MVVKLLVMDVMEDVREVVKVAAKVDVKIAREHVLLVMERQGQFMSVTVQSAFNVLVVIPVLAVQAVGLAKMVMTIQ